MFTVCVFNGALRMLPHNELKNIPDQCVPRPYSKFKQEPSAGSEAGAGVALNDGIDQAKNDSLAGGQKVDYAIRAFEQSGINNCRMLDCIRLRASYRPNYFIIPLEPSKPFC